MYEELLTDIRYCVSGDKPCGECKHIEELCCDTTLLEKAADAIEQLQKFICPHYIRNVHDRGDDSLCGYLKREVPPKEDEA